MEFSIIICTFNGAQRLPLVLSSIERLSIPESSTGELIIVDNNSTDQTRSIVEKFSLNFPLPLRYCFEGSQGLSYARNTGIKYAKGEIIIFTDDDCIVDANWLIEILLEFRSDAELMVLGGRIELYNQNDQPITLRRLTERRLFSSPQQIFSLLAGCNMAFRKSAFMSIGEFDVHYGAGQKIPSAEDSDFFYRTFRLNHKMVYCPNVLIYHNHGRRSDKQVDKLKKGYVIGQGALYCKYMLKKDAIIRNLFENELKRIIKTIIFNLDQFQLVFFCFRRLYALMSGFFYQLCISIEQTKAE